MRYGDCSTDAPATAAATPGSQPNRRRLELPRGLGSILGRREATRMAGYVLLSLIVALAGSIAAIVLVPLIQPGHAPMLGGRALPLPTGHGMLIAILAASVGSYALLRWVVAEVAARVISDCGMRLRNKAHATLIDADLTTLAGSTSAEIANVLTSNVELVTQGIGAVLQLLVAGLTTAVSLAFAFWVSPVLTLATPALVGFGLIASRCFGHEQSRVNRQYVEDMTRLFRSSEDFPQRLRHIRSFEREGAEKAGHGAISARLARGYRRQIELVASGRLILELLAAIGMVGVLLLAGRWHGMDPSSLIAVGLLLGRLLPYLASTRQNFQQLRLARPAFELWQRYANLDAVRREPMPTNAAGSEPRVRIEHVPTHAAGSEPRVRIEHVQLHLPLLRIRVEELLLIPGEMTLIAGDSGIGKSSLVDVLAGMTMPAAFAAWCGGRCVDFDAYRQLVRRGAYVSQGIRPWQRTVRECLLWAAPDATEEDLYGVLADAGFDKRLHGARDGLDMELQGSSSRLSGGEIQRLLLAQVILRQPFIAVLDEATGALDAVSEMKMLKTLKRRLPKSILIVVSHRHSPSIIADQCLCIGQDGMATVSRPGSVQRSTRS